MELFRKKNLATNIVFPLLTSGGNQYYTTSAWSNLTNRSVSAYSWADSISATALVLSQSPVQLSNTGLWNLSATATEMNPSSGNHDYITIKLKADQIQEQTILIMLTDYSIQDLANTSNVVNTNPVTVSAINGGLSIGVSAYTNFPSVKNDCVSAIDQVFSFSGTNTSFRVSAYDNFPSVNVSGIEDNIITSSDFAADYYNKIQSLSPTVNIDAVRVSAIDTSVVNSLVNTIMTSGNAEGWGDSVDINTLVTAIWNHTVDTVDAEEAIKIILAYASGNVTRVGDVYTYKNYNASSDTMTITGSNNGRTVVK
jgi:hypothetical protein